MKKRKQKLNQRAKAVIESAAQKAQAADLAVQTEQEDVLVDDTDADRSTVEENIRLSKKKYNDRHTTVRVKKEHKALAEEVAPIVQNGKDWSNPSRIAEGLIEWFADTVKTEGVNPVVEYSKIKQSVSDLKAEKENALVKAANFSTKLSIAGHKLEEVESRAKQLDEALAKAQEKIGFFRELIALIKKYWL